jgi:hypothetical protein
MHQRKKQHTRSDSRAHTVPAPEGNGRTAEQPSAGAAAPREGHPPSPAWKDNRRGPHGATGSIGSAAGEIQRIVCEISSQRLARRHRWWRRRRWRARRWRWRCWCWRRRWRRCWRDGAAANMTRDASRHYMGVRLEHPGAVRAQVAVVRSFVESKDRGIVLGRQGLASLQGLRFCQHPVARGAVLGGVRDSVALVKRPHRTSGSILVGARYRERRREPQQQQQQQQQPRHHPALHGRQPRTWLAMRSKLK